jgi:hypothetical protein
MPVETIIGSLTNLPVDIYQIIAWIKANIAAEFATRNSIDGLSTLPTLPVSSAPSGSGDALAPITTTDNTTTVAVVPQVYTSTYSPPDFCSWASNDTICCKQWLFD